MPDSGVYAFSDPDLSDIINKTQSAIDEMNTLNNLVQSHTEDLGTANQSDSGDILKTHLNTWTTDFHTCVNNLTDLNQKAQNLRQVNISAQDGAVHNAK
jgi:hypothetical protein